MYELSSRRMTYSMTCNGQSVSLQTASEFGMNQQRPVVFSGHRRRQQNCNKYRMCPKRWQKH